MWEIVNRDCDNMEEISLAAKAYYSNSSKEVQQHAKDFFQSMDTDGDGRVSEWEFTQFLQLNGYHQINIPNNFAELDANCDGYLNFMEFLSFYYTVKTRRACCDGCRESLCGLYFTCAECFDNVNNCTFNLCSPCYTERRFSHHHNQFVDSFVLLRSKRGLSHGIHNANKPLAQVRLNNFHSRIQCFQILELVFNIVGCLVGNCL